jgi:hypothetical protein
MNKNRHNLRDPRPAPRAKCRLVCHGADFREHGRWVTRCRNCNALLDAEPAPPCGLPEQEAEETRVVLGCAGAMTLVVATWLLILWGVREWIVWAK